MAAPSFSSPFQPYVYQSPQGAATPFQILGGDAQIVQIMLKSQEKVTARPGTMCYTSGSVQVDNVYFPDHEWGMWQWLFGKGVSSIVMVNTSSDVGFVGIAAPSPARILPVDLANFGGEILCQPDAFLCSVNDVTVANTVEQRAQIVTGSEVKLKQRLSGQGLAFLVAGGSEKGKACNSRGYVKEDWAAQAVSKILEAGEVLHVDVSCIVAMTTTINFQVKNSNSIRRAVFGGDNQLTASLTGPGIIFIQSLPFHRLSQRIARSVTPPGVRDNPKFFIQIAIFFFLAYIMIVSSFILTDA